MVTRSALFILRKLLQHASDGLEHVLGALDDNHARRQLLPSAEDETLGVGQDERRSRGDHTAHTACPGT